jgi:hypothetical protein
LSSGYHYQDGRTKATACKSINPINKLYLYLEDSIRVKCNSIFHGSLKFYETNLGSSDVIQFNYSHNNFLPGYPLTQFLDERDHKSNIIRYNISGHNGLKNKYVAIQQWGETQDGEIYDNTVYYSASESYKAYAVVFRQNEDPRIANNFQKKFFH